MADCFAEQVPADLEERARKTGFARRLGSLSSLWEIVLRTNSLGALRSLNLSVTTLATVFSGDPLSRCCRSRIHFVSPYVLDSLPVLAAQTINTSFKLVLPK
jgi:hypothetical protein